MYTQPKFHYRINYQITSPSLRLLDEEGKQIGIVSKLEALQKAKELNLDVVEIAPNAKPPVAKLIDSLGEITTAITGSGPNISIEESFLYADKANDDQSAHASSITAIKSDNLVPGQPLLFPDDFRISRNLKHQSKHRLRAYRRTAKKESAVSLPGQSSLFAADLRSARSA